MKDINEVLRKREVDLQQLQREVESLRIAARLLSEDAETAPAYTRPAAPVNAYAQPTRPAPPPPAGADAGYGASWGAAAKKFP